MHPCIAAVVVSLRCLCIMQPVGFPPLIFVWQLSTAKLSCCVVFSGSGLLQPQCYNACFRVMYVYLVDASHVQGCKDVMLNGRELLEHSHKYMAFSYTFTCLYLIIWSWNILLFCRIKRKNAPKQLDLYLLLLVTPQYYK